MNLKHLVSLIALGVGLSFSQAPTLNKTGGWFETAYVEWAPVNQATSYNVYYSGNGVTDKAIDGQLIRSYGSYLRADIPGLKAGDYTIKVEPVINGTPGTSTTSSTINVIAHDRSGFAFSGNRVPGAYKADGTPKDNAVILYITEKSKNTISLDVQTGSSSYTNYVGLQYILDGIKKGYDTRPFIFRIIGQVTDMSYMLNGDIVIENKNNASSYITIEGIGEDATVDGWGIRIKNASNVEARNLGIMNVNSGEGDNLGLQQGNDHIWVHNIDFFYGDAGSDSDQAKGDGALDCKKSTYVTFSYNHFWDSGKSNLLGLSEGTTQGLYITYHHNWYDHSDSRHPRVRYYSAHVYNNYYDGNSKYGIGSTLGSSVFSEGNYFRNAKYPMLTSMQGSDVWDTSNDKLDEDNATFSNEDGGTIKAFNNYIEGEKRFAPYNDATYTDSKVNFDAYVVSTRNEQVPSNITSRKGANTYNNFDTDSSVMYSYTAQSPADAKATVMQYAGRMNGGDFTWTFNNAVDDASYDVNTALKNKLTNYATTLVSIQTEGGIIVVPPSSSSETSSSSDVSSSSEVSSSSVDPSSSSIASSSSEDPSSSSVVSSSSSVSNIDADISHNFTTDALNSEFFAITGNLSNSKGTVNYGNLTLTQCLKMEAATSMSFSASDSITLTLVFNSDFNGGILVNGTEYTASSGIVEVKLGAGSYDITKADVANLYYVGIKLEDEITPVNPSSKDMGQIQYNIDKSVLTINKGLRVSNIEIYNLRGSLVRRKFNQQNSVDLSELSTGAYIVRLKTKQGDYQTLIQKK